MIAVPCNHHHVNSISILCISFMLDHQYISACVSVEHHLDYMSITIIIMLWRCSEIFESYLQCIDIKRRHNIGMQKRHFISVRRTDLNSCYINNSQEQKAADSTSLCCLCRFLESLIIIYRLCLRNYWYCYEQCERINTIRPGRHLSLRSWYQTSSILSYFVRAEVCLHRSLDWPLRCMSTPD